MPTRNPSSGVPKVAVLHAIAAAVTGAVFVIGGDVVFAALTFAFAALSARDWN